MIYLKPGRLIALIYLVLNIRKRCIHITNFGLRLYSSVFQNVETLNISSIH